MRKRTTTHWFKRVATTTITASHTADTALGFVFKLSDLPSSSEFTDLFDQYKISGVKVEFIPRGNSSDLDDGHTRLLYTAIDRTDDASPTLNGISQYQSMRKTPLTRRHKRYFKPAVLTSVATDPELTTTSLGSKWNQWINTAYPDVEHLGLKLFIAQLGGDIDLTLDMVITYYIGMRTVK